MDNLWIADFENSRVVRYPNILAGVSAVGTTGGELSANLVFGQPTLTFAVRNNQPINFTLTDAYGLAWAGNSLFISVANDGFDRVLYFPAPSSDTNDPVASAVLGQPNFITAVSGQCAQTSLSTPFAVDVTPASSSWPTTS